MGGKHSKSKDSQENGALLAIEKMRQAKELEKLPTLEPYEVNPFVANFLPGFGGGGGAKPKHFVQGMKHTRLHPKDFVVTCRVTGQSQEWHFMKPTQCARWTPNGDLLIWEAERIIREQNLKGVTGVEKLEKVYIYLDGQKKVDRKMSGGPSIELSMHE